jgi:site-specific DNA recombinase
LKADIFLCQLTTANDTQRENPKVTKPTAVGYIRVSTEEQATEGVSLDAQRATLQAYATLRGLDLIEIIVDEGVSGGKELNSRPGGNRVIELAGKGKVQAVVACKLDRLFRDAADCLNTTKAWDRKNVSLHLIDVGGQSIDTSSTMGRFFLTMMAGVAEMERNMIRDRTKAAMAHMKSKGQRVGPIPFGSDLATDGVSLVRNEQEQAIISLILELRTDGVSYQAIATELESRGVLTKTGLQKWEKKTVRNIAIANQTAAA